MRNVTRELSEARAAHARQRQRFNNSEEALLTLQMRHEAWKIRGSQSECMLEAAKVLLNSQEAVQTAAQRDLQLLQFQFGALSRIRKSKSDELRTATQKRASMGFRGRIWGKAKRVSRSMRKLRIAIETIDIDLNEIQAEVPQAEEDVENAKTEVSLAQQFLAIATESHRVAFRCAASLEPSVQEAKDQLAVATAELELLGGRVAGLQEEDVRGRADAEEPRLWRRATLPQGAGTDASGAKSGRVAQLAASVKVDWCVAARSSVTTSRCWDVSDFLGTPEAKALRDLNEDGQRGQFLLQLGGNEGPSSTPMGYILLETQLLAQICGPRVKSPPMRLNFFELLRTSLGDPLFNDVWLVPEAPHFHEVALGLDRMRDISPPVSLQPHLRPYQVKGFQWLAALARNGLGAILADDMGLGKTLQAITLLVHLRDEGSLLDEHGRPRPALVVVPPGLLRNWQQEFEKWAAHLRVYLYHGQPRRLPPNKGADFDIFLTTYHIVRNDSAKFCDVDYISFSCMIIDEAQCIKNHSIKMTKAVKEVGNAIGHTRIALSGTPIENKVDELHSIFDFANYGFLGDHASFSVKFSRLIEQTRDEQKRQGALDLLRRLTRPFQMRRLKTDPNILPDLPEKIDLLDSVGLTADQQRLYVAVQDDFRNRMETSRAQSGNHRFERRGHIFAMLEKARRICSHPLSLDISQYPESCRSLSVQASPAASGKTTRLFELLEEILPTGEKVIVFVTRKAVLAVLRRLTTERFTQVEVLQFSGDLSLQERALVEQDFARNPRAQVLLITVQCGGIGLNLVAASHVIHFDRCYNPAKEAQATDRCHRLGQRRAVCVHRLVTEGTYEERLEQIMQRKQDLSSLTVTRAEDWIADYDDQALFDLFMLRSSSGGLRPGTRAAAESQRLQPRGTTLRAARHAAGATPSAVLLNRSSEANGRPCDFASGSFPPAKRSKFDSSSSSSSPVLGSRHVEREECSICMDCPAAVKLLPCGHKTLCGECARHVATCPLCRSRISSRVPA
eukprot:TRINITY_DN61244_c0_g1_i1.p1 TRINITY_DN61244_c0_g1~~TRINITY_DN61244_c0_g1_i1.p1  ORF type:complete len:1017 (+),score=157.41 TRINITY_DN61244_c0_g1_i1:43-3093(+)